MASTYPPALERLIKALIRLPGIGPKAATRLALFMYREKRGTARELAQALIQAKEELAPCPRCFNLTDRPVCDICDDPQRDPSLICVVAGPSDVASVERSESFSGRYHVLGGLISPLDNVGPENLRIRELLRRADDPQIKEIVLAVSPTAQGQATAAYLVQELKNRSVKVSRIGFGLPMGADLDYADPVSLKASLEGRRDA